MMDEEAAVREVEAIRVRIAANLGLPALAVADQMAAAMAVLGVQGQEQAALVENQINSALVCFTLRGFPTGLAPNPAQLRKAIKRIAESARNIESDLELIMMARRGTQAGEATRADTLQQIQHAILGSIAANAIPSALRRTTTYDEIADTMPTAELLSFSNVWIGGFANIAHDVEKLHAAFEADAFARPTNVIDDHFAAFIGRLAAIYEEVKGEVPHAPDPSESMSSDWRGPFPRFVAAVWPLTPEGSGGHGDNRRCPSNKRIREGLRHSAGLLTENAT